MTEKGIDLRLTVDCQGQVAVISTEGYLNRRGGEAIASTASDLVDQGHRLLVLNLAGSRIVNSVGLAFLLEVLDGLLEVGGRLCLCGLTPTVSKIVGILGLARYVSIYDDLSDALEALSGAPVEGRVPERQAARDGRKGSP